MTEKEINNLLKQNEIFVFELPTIKTVDKNADYYKDEKNNRIN